MASISLNNVAKDYGSYRALEGVNFQINDNEFVVLVGPSGCGKSTLLRMIAGLEDISSGTIAIDGAPVNHLGPQKRDLAMVFQSYALYPHLTIAENIGFPLKLRGLSKREIDAGVSNVASTLHLEALLDRKPAALSGGQRQRVAMGRAMVRNPKAFLFDEPLSNLDAKLRHHMRIELRDLHKKLNATSIYVTHDQVEAMTLADRIVVMNKGRVEQIGTPLELFDKPQNQFVAGFLGSPTINFGNAVLKADAGQSYLQFDNGRVDLNLPISESLNNRPVVVGIRPQFVKLVDPNSCVLRGEVDLVEQTGCETNIVLTIGEDIWTVQSSVRQNISAGQSVGLSFDSVNVHLFSPDTGNRIELHS